MTGGAVALSNIAVAFWFEYGNEQQSAIAANERVLDRAAAVATTLTAVPASSRHVVMNTMSTRVWKFTEIPVPGTIRAMTPEESTLAKHLADMLPDHIPNQNLISVRLHTPYNDLPPDLVPHNAGVVGDSIQAIVPVDKNTMMSGVFVRPPAPLADGNLRRRRGRHPGREPGRRPCGAPGCAAVVGTDQRSRGHDCQAWARHTSMSRAPPTCVKQPLPSMPWHPEVTRTLDSQRHLLSAVGHDLRTPITAMRINLEFIDDDELRDGLMRNLDELQVLTEQVLSAAKGTGGEPPRQVDLSALVESLCTDLDELGEPVSWATHAPAPISCRPNEIKRAVRNLVENAVAYGHKADVRIADAGDGYDVLVEDEGPGIPEGERQRVFEPFVRLESSRNEDTGGTGLGLTLVKAIVEGHGGAVGLENRPGGGLRARMHLPRVAANA